MQRVTKIQRRNVGGPDAGDYEGEHVYMPLAGMNITDNDVQAFWDKQSWGLELNRDENLSNCTFCFLKGSGKLASIREKMDAELDESLKNTPCDINWWVGIEEKYGRDMVAENRPIKSSVADNFIGFFGASSALTYRKFAEGEVDVTSEESLPCDCTD